jgi:heptosyltransferase-2
MDSIGSFSLHTDCLHFRGDLPCKPHKQHGYECVNCPAYSKIEHTVLIIKLGAIGDVIRTTPLIHKLRLEYPNAKITWLTLTPSILPATAIDQILTFTFQSVIYLSLSI